MIYKTSFWWYAIPPGIDDIQCFALIYFRFYAIIHPRRWLYENSSNIFMDYNLYNFLVRTFIFIYRFVGMVSYTWTTGKSTYNCYCYDGNTCYQRHYTVIDKKKVKIFSFQAHFIRVIKFKTPKKSSFFGTRIFLCFYNLLVFSVEIWYTKWKEMILWKK